MDFPIPATVAPMQENIIIYDPEASVVVNKGTYYSADYVRMTANEMSNKLIAHANLSQRVENHQKCDEDVRKYLIENYEEIGSEHADEIARLLQVDLIQTIEVEFDITIRASITIPVGKKFDDISEYDFDIEISSNESDWEIEEFEADLNRMRELS